MLLYIFVSTIFEDEIRVITVYEQDSWDFNSVEYLNEDVVQTSWSIEFHSNSTGMNLTTMGHQIIPGLSDFVWRCARLFANYDYLQYEDSFVTWRNMEWLLINSFVTENKISWLYDIVDATNEISHFGVVYTMLWTR